MEEKFGVYYFLNTQTKAAVMTIILSLIFCFFIAEFNLFLPEFLSCNSDIHWFALLVLILIFNSFLILGSFITLVNVFSKIRKNIILSSVSFLLPILVYWIVIAIICKYNVGFTLFILPVPFIIAQIYYFFAYRKEVVTNENN